MDGAFLTFAEALLDAGYSPLPVIPGRKKPALKGWSNYCETPLSRERIRDYAGRWPEAGLGLALGYGGVIALDIDTIDGRQIEAVCSTLPPSPVAKMGQKGFTRYYRAPAGAAMPTRHFGGICDLIASGGGNVLPPSMHPCGRPYRWLTEKTLLDMPAADLPEAPADLAERLEAVLEPWLPKKEAAAPHETRSIPATGHELRRLIAFAKSGLARKARELADTGEGSRNNTLFSLGAGLGKFVHHGIVQLSTVEAAALAACLSNGLLREDGKLACLATLRSGIARAKDDELPALVDREFKSQPRTQKARADQARASLQRR